MTKLKITFEDLSIDEASEIFNKLNGIQTVYTPTVSDVKITVDTPDDEEQGVDDGSPVDADGLTWDERIHSSSHKKTAKGVWARRRGVEDSYFDSIKNELLGKIAPVAAPIVSGAAPLTPPSAPVAVPPIPDFLNRQIPVQDFPTLIQRIQGAVASGKMDVNGLTGIVAAINSKHNVQMAAITDVAGHQHLIDAAFEEMNARGV